MCNAWNHPPGCMCGWGGVGHLGRRYGGYSYYSKPTWYREFEDPGTTKLTHPTECWDCGESVFFHRDENGGCVLFDRLGPPWPVHSCWKENRPFHLDLKVNEMTLLYDTGTSYRERAVSTFKDELKQNGYRDYNFYSFISAAKGWGWSHGIRCVTSPGGDESRISVTGYLASRPEGYGGVSLFARRRAEDRDPVWLVLRVDKRKAYRVGFPAELRKELPDSHSVVRFEGCWLPRGKRWALVGEWITTYDGENQRPRRRRGFKLPEDMKCAFCGAKEGKLGFAEPGLIECARCARFRGKCSPEEFVDLCRVVAEFKSS